MVSPAPRDPDRSSVSPDGVSAAVSILRAWASGETIGGMEVQAARAASTVLTQNRLLGLTSNILLASTPDAQISDTVAAFRRLTAEMNGANLIMMRRLATIIAKIPARVVVYKGVVLQADLYKSAFARPASDVDLLTAPSDYALVAEALEAAGYHLDPHTDTLWWRQFLAEQQFRTSPEAPSIDLHHRLQQPGCPMPRQAGRLLSAATSRMLFGSDVLTFRPDHTLLVAAMSLAKALHHREPAGRYVGDAERLLRRLSPNGWAAVAREAEDMGLSRTLDLTVRAVDVIFGTVPSSQRRVILEEVADIDLQWMLLDPLHAPHWIRRRRLLHALCDRPTDALSAWMVMAASEAARLTTARRPGREAR